MRTPVNKKQFLAGLGSRIRKLRKKRGLSAEDLAMLCGLDRSHYGYIERGQCDARSHSLYKIAKALGMSVCELVCTHKWHKFSGK